MPITLSQIHTLQTIEKDWKLLPLCQTLLFFSDYYIDVAAKIAGCGKTLLAKIMTQCLKLIACLLIFTSSPALLFAAESKPETKLQDISLIKKAVNNFIYSNTMELSGKVVADIGEIDKRITLPLCPELSPFLPTGARLWGKTSIGVRCNSATAWTIYVPAEINVMANVLYMTRPVSRGEALNIGDVAPKLANLVKMPEDVATDLESVIGRIALNNLSSGQPLRQQMLRAPYVIFRGQKVKLVVQGQGFNVTSDGQALADAAEGQVVQVRNQSGRVISGLARLNSIVDIQH